jgi:uncharacterized membrane protein
MCASWKADIPGDSLICTTVKTDKKSTYKKTLTFSALHFFVAFSVIWALTGSPFIGGVAAIIEPTMSSVVYFFHERVWEKFSKKSPNSKDRTFDK